jgi:hypothetical protein
MCTHVASAFELYPSSNIACVSVLRRLIRAGIQRGGSGARSLTSVPPEGFARKRADAHLLRTEGRMLTVFTTSGVAYRNLALSIHDRPPQERVIRLGGKSSDCTELSVELDGRHIVPIVVLCQTSTRPVQFILSSLSSSSSLTPRFCSCSLSLFSLLISGGPRHRARVHTEGQISNVLEHPRPLLRQEAIGAS